MTIPLTQTAPSPHTALVARWREAGLGPFLATPCGILAPLLRELDRVGLLTVSREDNAVGVAAGMALAGARPVVLMQNSGLGQAVNALASLVAPYQIPMLLVVSLRGTGCDTTEENIGMGRLTHRVLDELGIRTATARADADLGMDDVLQVVAQGRPAALFVPPELFGWAP